MDFYNYLQLNQWKTLSDEQKQEVFAGVLRFYLKPGTVVQNSRLVTFEMRGMKCRSFELEINGESFVLIPGQKDTVLGWDFGSKGLQTSDLLEASLDLYLDQLRYQSKLSTQELDSAMSESSFSDNDYDLTDLSEIDRYINDLTTPLRKVDIPAMLVAKKAQPVGTFLLGAYESVTGIFKGNQEFLTKYQGELENLFQPQLSLAESLTWSFPKSSLKNNHYYIQQQEDNPDNYWLYGHELLDYGELWLTLHRSGFQLLSEDCWEYAVGGGTRRLFRWGNEIDLESSHPFTGCQERVKAENMFGLKIPASQDSFELTDDVNIQKLSSSQLVADSHKIEKILPLSSYYRSPRMSQLVGKLNPHHYSYRKGIIIDPN